jgi:hypothetical protein
MKSDVVKKKWSQLLISIKFRISGGYETRPEKLFLHDLHAPVFGSAVFGSVVGHRAFLAPAC